MSQKKHKTKIGHSLEELEDGLILTLQDKPVIVGGQINEDDDVFENFERRQMNQAEHNRELKEKLKVISNAATSHIEAKNEGAKNLLPHYDDYRYKSDELDLEDGTITKRAKPKVSKALPADFQTANNVNSQYYERSTKFKQRSKQKATNNAELLDFLNETAVQKQLGEDNTANIDVIAESLDNVRKRKKIENQVIQAANRLILGEQEEMLARAIKATRHKNNQVRVLDMIKQEGEEAGDQANLTEIEMRPVNYKLATPEQETKKVYNITDAAKGTTSCLFVNLPSEKIASKKQEQSLPSSFKDLTPEELEKMKEEVAFLDQKVANTGLASTLEFLRTSNLLNREEQFGRTNDKELNINQPGDRVKLEYRNASGKLMKPKEAFRYLSAIFHGQGPGKNKIEKIKKKQIMEMRIKEAANGPGKLMGLLEKSQTKSGEAHLVMQLGAKNKPAE